MPYRTPVPDDPRAARRARILRAIVYAVVVTAFVIPVIQFQRGVLKTQAKREKFDRRFAAGKAEWENRPEGSKGAVSRWAKAVRQFWGGHNIYAARPEASSAADGQQDPDPAETPPTASTASAPAEDSPDARGRPVFGRRVALHPNMPFVVVLLTPFAYLPTWAMALSFNLVKLAALAATLLMVARVAAHHDRRIPDWVLALGVLWAMLFIIGDIQHGNTNVFVLAAVAWHLWLYRRGRSFLAGGPLALAICLKMTPALFLLYWVWQRNGRLLAGAAVFGVVLAVIVPATAVGPERYATLTRTWLDNLIIPGLVEGAWYPIHQNQSLGGVLSRYFLGGKWGDLNYNPDDDPVYELKEDPPEHITVAALSPPALKWILRALQLGLVGVAAWAIGWRKLPRDDGRRALHYGLVVLGMMILNQRTWDHHAAVLLVATVPVWQAIAFGRMSRKARKASLALMIAGGLAVWLTRSELSEGVGRLLYGADDAAEHFANVVESYGPTLVYFLAVFAAGVIVSVWVRRREQPYADVRQTLSTPGHDESP